MLIGATITTTTTFIGSMMFYRDYCSSKTTFLSTRYTLTWTRTSGQRFFLDSGLIFACIAGKKVSLVMGKNSLWR